MLWHMIIKPLTTLEEFEDCLRVQKETLSASIRLRRKLDSPRRRVALWCSGVLSR